MFLVAADTRRLLRHHIDLLLPQFEDRLGIADAR
jgi:hypothetical protein